VSERSCGILLHPTSLPGRYGIGDLGDEAARFVDFLAEGRQGLWQVLPLGPTGYGDSPYQSFSAFAGNPLLVSPDRLVERGLLDRRDVAHPPRFSHERVEYGPVIEYKRELLARACERFRHDADTAMRREFAAFCSDAGPWLETYVLFHAIKAWRGGEPWSEWEARLALRDPAALAEAAEALRVEVDSARVAQYLFFSQWRELREYAALRDVSIVGDAPIFVAYDSADVWANRELFKLDAHGRPLVVAGVPPDYFSETGQLWGNPIYDWRRMRETGFAWWIDRIRAALSTVDLLRIDHFRGFAACWEVPAGEPTAVDGSWVEVPGRELFEAVRDALGDPPILAEDLGIITPDVDALREEFGFPGMRVLQFGFGEGAVSRNLPHNFDANSVVYTGTHDNDTTVGWFRSGKGRAARKERTYCRDYLNAGPEIHWSFIRAAYASVARTAIVPMQDALGLGSEARMNLPASSEGNWDWRMPARAATHKLAHRLRDLAEIYGRATPEKDD
jgi:4-alpha-glucanotransferase